MVFFDESKKAWMDFDPNIFKTLEVPVLKKNTLHLKTICNERLVLIKANILMYQHCVTYFLSVCICNLLEHYCLPGITWLFKIKQCSGLKICRNIQTSRKIPSLKTVNVRLLDQVHHENSYSHQFKNTNQRYRS